MENPLDFFREKNPWSKYKDLILDYYLVPYLTKVSTLRKPILIVDCFAGAGRFDDGRPGSPLIISERLRKIYERGTNVLGLYIEKEPILYQRLKRHIQISSVPVKICLGDFRNHLDEIVNLARNHTVFVYLDPLRPSDLLFDDMQSVYEQLKGGSSVETLINFMSTSFLRAVQGQKHIIAPEGKVQHDHKFVLRWDKVAGGKYWYEIAFNNTLSQDERADQLAAAYAEQLSQWFQWRLRCAIREKYEYKYPKYHMVFGSRSHHAVDLMNRAIVKARREFIKDGFIKGFLFPNQPEKEIFNLEEVIKIIVQTSQKVGNIVWRDLRIHATIANPGIYTDSEFNRAIKTAIKWEKLGSDCAGKKIQENAVIWPLS